jgi:hypothetical protein
VRELPAGKGVCTGAEDTGTYSVQVNIITHCSDMQSGLAITL